MGTSELPKAHIDAFRRVLHVSLLIKNPMTIAPPIRSVEIQLISRIVRIFRAIHLTASSHVMSTHQSQPGAW
jgi:hypothetical protein